MQVSSRLTGRFIPSSAVEPEIDPEGGPCHLLAEEGVIFWFLFVHVLLGVLVYAWPTVATLHALLCLIVGVRVVATSTRPSSIATVAAYVMGCEVLWRMARASIPWEAGKYGVVVLLAAGLLRFSRAKLPRAAIAYLALLMPGVAVLFLNATQYSDIRGSISFYMSGPLTLAVAVAFFAQVTLSRSHLIGILVAVVGPAISIATVTLVAIGAAARINFQAASNFATSGGYGPNQVSAALSMGAVLCFLLLVTQPKLGTLRRLLLLTALVVCSVQSAMTFSRGGLYMAVIAMLGASMFLVRDGFGRRMLVGVIGAGVLLFFLVAPELVDRTDGAISARFQDVGTTSRWDLIQDDLQLWRRAPVLGIGVGMGFESRSTRKFTSTAAHTEWSRMLGEHGFFGLVALLVLVSMMAGSVMRARGPLEKAVAASLVLWAASFLMVNAMRTAAPSFIVGLASASLQLSTLRPRGGRQGMWRRRPAITGRVGPLRTIPAAARLRHVRHRT